MRQGLERAKAVEIQLAAGGARAASTQLALERASTTLARRSAKSTSLIEGLGAGDPTVPRIVIGTLEDPQMVALVQHFGIETENGATFAGLGLRGNRDRWELRGPDPVRPGLPLTVYLGVRWGALEDCLDRLTLGGRAGLTMISAKDGQREFDWRARVRGLEFHERENWLVPAQLETPQLALHVGARILAGRSSQYQSQAIAALERVSGWVGEPLTSKLHVFLVDDANYLHSFAQSSDLAVSLGLRNHRLVLLGKALPHDGGACVAAWAAKELLGPAIDPWLQEAAGIDGAGTWWGRDLPVWGKHLLAAQLLPSVQQLVEPTSAHELSQHQLSAGRGLLFRYLRGARGPEFLKSLWSGESSLKVDDSIEQGFRQWLQDTPTKTSPRQPAQRVAGSFLTGVALDSTARIGGGYDNIDLDQSLSSARATGADSLSITSYFNGTPNWREQASTGGRQASEGDVSIAQVVARSRNAQLGFLAFQPHILLSDSTGHSAWQRRTSAAHWQEFFDELNPALVHYALLAELCRVDLLCVGTSLSRRNANRSLAPQAHQTFSAGWSRAIGLARGGFSGLLTYAAEWDGEAQNYPHWDALDFVGISYFPQLKELGQAPPAEPYLDLRWSSLLKSLDELAASAGKPVLMMEFGVRSVTEGANETAVGAGPASAQLQLQYYRAFAQALERRRAAGNNQPDAFGGFFAWKWSARPSSGGTMDRSFDLRGKPAAQILPSLAPVQ